MSALGREKGPTSKQFGAQIAPGSDLLSQFQRILQKIAGAAHRSDAAIEVGREPALPSSRIHITLLILVNPTGRPDMNVHIDEARNNSFSRTLNNLRIERLRIGRRRLKDFRDLSVAHQDGAILD